MKILIDCGAHKGTALPLLLKKEGPFDLIHLFECNPKLIERLTLNLPKKYPSLNLKIHNQAIWDRDGYFNFYLGAKGHKESSSLVETKKGLSTDTKVVVECINFSIWLRNNFSPEDKIIIKMDIEGAEYPVLETLIKDRTIELVNVLYCEWHAGRRLPPKEESRKRHDNLLGLLRKEKISVKDWDIECQTETLS